MTPSRTRRGALLAVLLALAAGLSACGRANEETGNPGQEPQTPGVEQGENPAVEQETNAEEDAPQEP